MSEKIVFTVVKDEAPFLLEWIAFYRMIGFDTVVIYSNNSTDRTDELCAAMAAEGLIEHHIHQPEGRSPQGHAAWLFRRSGRAKPGDWVLFCDPDEFLNVKFGGHRVDDLIAHMPDKQGILLTWRMFGDAGRQCFTGRSIDPAYCWAAAEENPNNRVVKTLFRYGPEVEFMGVHGPRMTAGYWTEGRPFVSARLTDIDPALPAYAKWRETGQIVTCDSQDSSYRHVQLNHYFTRSAACFAMKQRRGIGGRAPDRADYDHTRYAREHYDASNFNQVQDKSILVLGGELDNIIREFMSVQKIESIQGDIRRDFLLYEAEFIARS